MFLTKKGFWKIVAIAICYFVLGSFCIALGVISELLGVDAKIQYLGIILCFLCPVLGLWGRYAEGEGKLINLGNKLVRNELKPAEFIKHYEDLKNSPDLVINKPSFDTLRLIAVAYDSLDMREKALSAVDELIAVASEKKKTLAKLTKISYMFSYGMTKEAEALFAEVQGLKLNFMCQAMTDAILKSDRAMAMGDYKVVETHCLKMLAQTFPKLDNLSRLVLHFGLGEVYEKLQDNEKASLYYQYCVDNGGETAMKSSAKTALERLATQKEKTQ